MLPPWMLTVTTVWSLSRSAAHWRSLRSFNSSKRLRSATALSSTGDERALAAPVVRRGLPAPRVDALQLVEDAGDLLGGQEADVLAVDVGHRADLAGAHAAGPDLHGHLAVGAGLAALGDAEALEGLVEQLARAEGVAGGAVAEGVGVRGAGRGAQVGVEGQQVVDALELDAQVVGHHLGGVLRDVAPVLLDVHQGEEGQL